MYKITWKTKRSLAALTLVGTLMLSGCQVEIAPDNTNYDMIDTNSDGNGYDDVSRGVRQVLDVPGEDFKLVIEYQCGEGEWRVTSDKELYMTIYTQGLDSSKKVYIDDIHIDTYIASGKAIFDGILQDTLDDGVHNSVMIGFPISDDNSYVGVNKIEGQNDTFIRGFVSGMNGYYSGSVTERRYTESAYLKQGVYANKISGVIGLVIEDVMTGEIVRAVDVDTKLFIKVNNKVTFEESDKYVTYEYDKDGNRKVVSTVPIDGKTEESSSKVKIRKRDS